MPNLSSIFSASDSILPELTHRANGSTLSVENEATRLKYFQRRSGWPKQEPRDSEDRLSTAIPRKGSGSNNDVFSSIPTAFCFADYVFTTDKASTDTLAFANLIHIVRKDTNEASRLYLSSAASNFLDAYPTKRKWVETTLLELRRTLNDIGLDIGHDEDGGTVASKRNLEWGLRNQKKLVKRHEQLKNCHDNLTGVILVMQTAELCGKSATALKHPVFEAPVRPWVPLDEKDALRGPYSRLKYRGSNTNLSASHAPLSSEADKYDIDNSSVNSIPVELAGSTPRDLVITEPLHEISFRASIDVIRTSSKATESTIERNDSTMSTTATVSVPMVARRYRATSIDIQRQPEKHRSLPSELPHVASQSSLVDDLVDYVLPNAASEKTPSKEGAPSPTLSMPSIAVTSSPTTSPPLPAVPETTSVANRIVYESTLQFAIEHADDEQPPPLPPRPRPQNQSSIETMFLTTSQKDSSSLTQTASPQSCHTPSSHSNTSAYAFTGVIPDDEPVRRPSSQRPSQRLSKKRASHAPSSKSSIAQPSPKTPALAEPQESIPEENHHATSVPVAINPPTSPHPTSAHAAKKSHHDTYIPKTGLVPPITTSAPANLGESICIPVPSRQSTESQQPTTSTETNYEKPTSDDDGDDDESNDAVLSRLRSRLQSQSAVKLMAEELVREQRGETKEVQEGGEVLEGKIEERNEGVGKVRCLDGKGEGEERKEGGKGGTAQDKRRAAHRRRMVLAFGGGV